MPYRNTLYTHTIDLLTLRHLGGLALSSAELKTLVIPALGTNLVKLLLLVTAGSRASLATALSRFQSLDEGGVVAIQRIAFQVILMLFVGESKGTVFGVRPPSTCE